CRRKYGQKFKGHPIFRGKKKPGKKIIKAQTSSKPDFRKVWKNTKKLDHFIKPMLAKLGKEPFDSEDWVFEIKWDGYRAIANLRNSEPLFYSRNGISYEDKFESLFKELKKQEQKMIIDGEIIAYDENGKPNFQLLQQSGQNPNTTLVYQVFDLLWLNGHSTESLNLLERKELLKEALKETPMI